MTQSVFMVCYEKLYIFYAMGFKHAALGALVRSSYHADEQAHSVK